MGKCSAHAYDNFRHYPCRNRAKVERDGKGYCGVHDPERLKAIREESERRWEEQAKARARITQINRADLARLRKIEEAAERVVATDAGLHNAQPHGYDAILAASMRHTAAMGELITALEETSDA